MIRNFQLFAETRESAGHGWEEQQHCVPCGVRGEDGAEPRQTGRFGRGSCSPRGRPKDQRGELEVYAPLLPPAGPGRRHRGAPGPRRTPPLPTSAGGPGVPASSARQPVGAPSTPARSQPFQPPAVRRSGPLAQLPGGRGEPVSCARGVCFRAVPPRLRLPRERHGLAGGGGVRPGRSGHRRPGPALPSRSRFSRSFWSFRGFALLHVLESAY